MKIIMRDYTDGRYCSGEGRGGRNLLLVGASRIAILSFVHKADVLYGWWESIVVSPRSVAIAPKPFERVSGQERCDVS